MVDAKAFGTRLREVRSWRELTLREASGLAGLSFSFWGQVERGEKAVALADRLDDEVGAFANLWFGRANVGIWRVSLATELGEGGRVAELARDVHPEVLPVQRQSMYWADLGRSLVTERRTRDQGVQALIHAEQLAPQQIRNNLFVRETVAGLLRQARRDAGGRELRGLAWRMGVAPIR